MVRKGVKIGPAVLEPLPKELEIGKKQFKWRRGGGGVELSLSNTHES